MSSARGWGPWKPLLGFIELKQPSVTLPDKACMRVQISKKMHRQETIFASSNFYLNFEACITIFSQNISSCMHGGSATAIGWS